MNRKHFALILLLALPSFAASRDTVFVVLGGFFSCENSHSGPKPQGIGMYSRLDSLQQRVAEAGARVGYIVSCFNSDPPPSGQMQYITSERPEQTELGNASDLQAAIERMVGHFDDPAVHLMGHSYGGWLAMYLTERMNLPSGLASLSTVDPISTACGTVQYIFGMKECKQAPKDRNNAQILSATKAWMNFYQTADGSLHSGEIPEAQNFLITYRGPHSEIDTDDRTWAAIEAKVLGQLF